nr:hypothetical protein [Microbispora siamensis]
MTRIAHRFSRIEPRRAANAYVRGLLSDVERKNCWALTGRPPRSAAHVPDDHWHLHSAGRGAKGHRWYAWAWTRIDTHRPGHRGAGLLPLLRAPADTTGRPGAHRRHPLDH